MVPSELMEKSLFKGKLNPLKVMSKIQWLELKEEFKKIKKELVQHLQAQNPDNHHLKYNEQTDRSQELPKGCLVRIKNLPTENIDKQTISAAVSTFWTPKYVDYRKGFSECIIRFEDNEVADSFIKKYRAEDLVIQNKKVSFIKNLQFICKGEC